MPRKDNWDTNRTPENKGKSARGESGAAAKINSCGHTTISEEAGEAGAGTAEARVLTKSNFHTGCTQ